MDIELLAKKMREEALASESYWTRKVEEMKAERERAEQERMAKEEQELEQLKKTFFNAGRYAGGARDKTAIEAWKKVSLIA
jgi:DNA topoisomerase VI subunit A